MRSAILLVIATVSWSLASTVRAEEAQSAKDGGAVNIQNLVPSVDRQRADEERDAKIDAAVTDLASFVKWARAARDERVQSLYQRRETIRAGKGNSRLKREQIESTNEEITRINTPSLPYVPRVSANKVITLAEMSPTRYLQVLQVIGDKNARVRLVENSVGGKQREFFLTGNDISGWIDGQKPALDGVLIADGTKSYATTDGAQRTITAMRHYAIPKDDLTRRDDIRTWTDENGKSVTGAFVLYDAGKVTIMDMDGKASALKLTELSAEDRAYVDQHAPTPAPRKPPAAPAVPPAAGK